MKLLLFSDLHCDMRAARSIVDRSENVDVVIGAGDFANVRRGLKEMIGVLSDIKTPSILVAGNSETHNELVAACKEWPSAVPLHGEIAEVEGFKFLGLGGAVPITPFGSWSFDLSEEEAAKLLLDVETADVFVAHSPPAGYVDRDSGGRNLGSQTILQTIQTLKPKLFVCGHIHGSWEETAEIGECHVVNAGPKGCVVEIN